MAGQNALAMTSFGHAHGAQAVEAGRKTGGKTWRHVLGNGNGGAVGGQAQQHFADGLGAAGGGSNANHLLGGGQPRQWALARCVGGWWMNCVDGGARTTGQAASASGGRRYTAQGWGGHRCCHRRRGQPCHTGLAGDADLVHNLITQLAQARGHAQARLGHKVDRAHFQRAHGDFGPAFGQGRYHDHGHGPQPHQARQKLQPVHLGHFHVQRDDIRVKFTDHFTRGQWIVGRADAHHVGLLVDDFGQQTAHQRRIVHHHHSDFGHLVVLLGCGV